MPDPRIFNTGLDIALKYIISGILQRHQFGSKRCQKKHYYKWLFSKNAVLFNVSFWTDLYKTTIFKIWKKLTWALADVGKTSTWVQVVSLGVDNWQLLAFWPNRSSGVYWSAMSLKCESGSIETKQADKMHGTSLFQAHNSRNSLVARFKVFRLSKTLHPANIKYLVIETLNRWQYVLGLAGIKTSW